VLTALQTWRIVGFVFLLLDAHRTLPAIFALPAGYGDMFIGTTASLVAWRLADAKHRGAFIAWQLLGILDLLVAVGSGITARLVDSHGVSMLPMTVLPLSIVPTFLVPLFLIFHVICIAQARQWDVAKIAVPRGRFGALQEVAEPEFSGGRGRCSRAFAIFPNDCGFQLRLICLCRWFCR
jgi:hypothetical protein